MCGIVGAYGERANGVTDILPLLAHRGPNGQATVAHQNSYLGHTRLAIVDVEGGQQPLSDAAATRWMICNGEIYNHPQLRQQFSGYPYKTRSDSEDILAVYDRYHEKTPDHLQGMFALAILDGNKLFLARDPLGIKPLYFGWAGQTLLFASEIKALQDHVDQVREFPPGYWYQSDRGFVQYYDLHEATALLQRAPVSFPEIYAQLERAVESHLMADVPIGVFLSGGLDSSIIAALMKCGCQNLTSFAVGMAGSADLLYARQTAKMLGTRHFEYVYTVQEMQAVLPTVIYHLESFDPALVRSAIANYFLARLASEYVTVILAGEGADELFSGYHYLKQISDIDRLHQELLEITAELHNRNLQRLDRMTMAHGVEGRVPFLDRLFVEFALTIPIEQKITGENSIEKWLLRKSFQHLLPEEIVWRRKEKFSKGAGSAHIFEQLAADEISDAQFVSERNSISKETGHQIQSKEELYYYRIFCQFFKVSVTKLVGFSRSL